MGQEQSALVASHLQGQTIDELLKNDQFVSDMGPSVQNLSPKSIRNLQALANTSQRPRRLENRLTHPKFKPFLSVKESQIGLPSALYTQFMEWTQDWTKVFGGDSSLLTSRMGQERAIFLPQAYQYVIHLEKRRALDRIRWRFYTMLFYDLHQLLNNQTKLTKRAYQALIDAINPSLGDAAEIEQNLRSWISRGHRYRNLSNALGGSGCLFVLPESISDYMWEELLPLTGPTFDQAVQHLLGLGIRESAMAIGAGDLGSRIEHGILNTFSWEITWPSEFQGTGSNFQAALAASNDPYAVSFPGPGESRGSFQGPSESQQSFQGPSRTQ